MTNQKLQLSDQTQAGIPDEWKEKFVLKRIEEKDIIISLEERDYILKSLNAGGRFIQIGKYTLMLNSVKSIDPFYEPNNIPPQPKQEYETKIVDGQAIQIITNKKELELWNSLYQDKIIKEEV